MFTGVGGPAGIALMAASGALLSGGISVASQKATMGEVDWRQAGIDTAIGGATGALGAGAGAVLPKLAPLASRAGSAVVSSAGRAGTAIAQAGGRAGSFLAGAGQRALSVGTKAITSQIAKEAGANALAGGVGNMGTYAVKTLADGRDLTLQGAGASFVGGTTSGLISGGGSGAANLLRLKYAASTLSTISGSVGSVTGGVLENAAAGPYAQGYGPGEGVFDFVAGASLAQFPGARDLAGPDAVPSLATHAGTAWAGQHAAWIADSTKLIAEETGVVSW